MPGHSRTKTSSFHLGGIAKAVYQSSLGRIKTNELSVLLGLRSDPYDTYKYILETYQSKLDHLMFFFLIGDRNQFDKNMFRTRTNLSGN